MKPSGPVAHLGAEENLFTTGASPTLATLLCLWWHSLLMAPWQSEIQREPKWAHSKHVEPLTKRTGAKTAQEATLRVPKILQMQSEVIWGLRDTSDESILRDPVLHYFLILSNHVHRNAMPQEEGKGGSHGAPLPVLPSFLIGKVEVSYSIWCAKKWNKYKQASFVQHFLCSDETKHSLNWKMQIVPFRLSHSNLGIESERGRI